MVCMAFIQTNTVGSYANGSSQWKMERERETCRAVMHGLDDRTMRRNSSPARIYSSRRCVDVVNGLGTDNTKKMSENVELSGFGLGQTPREARRMVPRARSSLCRLDIPCTR